MTILNSCSTAIPKTGSRISTKYCCFWWTPECKIALSNAKRQLRTLRRFHCPANVVEYKRLDAIATRTLREAKSLGLRNFLSTVNKDTNIIKLWKVINALNGKHSSFKKIIISINNVGVSDPRVLTQEFGNFFSNISSDNNYSEDFFIHKLEEEANPIVSLPLQVKIIIICSP